MSYARAVRSLIITVCTLVLTAGSAFSAQEMQVTVPSNGWELIGDLVVPESQSRLPAVLMLNQAAGNRQPYQHLASALAERGIASLRLDLRGHGESTNLGEFQPEGATAQDRETFIWNADEDVVAAHRFLRAHPAVDPDRIGIVGASYSGEEMAEAGRDTNYATAYVVLSPGSFSDESISAMDSSAPWFFIVSKDDQFLHEIAAKVKATTASAEILYLPGNNHATDILGYHPGLAERIAVWLADNLNR